MRLTAAIIITPHTHDSQPLALYCSIPVNHKSALPHTQERAQLQGHEAQKSGVGVSKSSRLTTIFSTSRDHFPGDIPATVCMCHV
jgi:hypothetical protein